MRIAHRYTPLPTPRASLRLILATCLRRVTLPIERRLVNEQVDDAKLALLALERLGRLHSRSACACADDERQREEADLREHLDELRRRQRALERENEG